MAIVQISKIIHRTGANVDLPQLDTGELGYANDDRRLYIGDDPVSHPPVTEGETTQTEILTEHSELSFSKIGGTSNTSLELSNVKTGQLLVASGNSTVANTWINWDGNRIGPDSQKLILGTPANIKITGGVNGMFLATDGQGNLTWTDSIGAVTIEGTPGGTGLGEIQFNTGNDFDGVSQFAFDVANSNLTLDGNANITGTTLANVVGTFNGTVGATTPNSGAFTTIVTSSVVNAGGNLSAANISTAGNLTVTGNTESGNIKTTGTANVGDLIVAGNVSSSLIPEPTETFDLGDIDNKWNNLYINGAVYVGDHSLSQDGDNTVLSGNLVVDNADLGNSATANFFTGTLTTSAQPNITSIGNLESLRVTGVINLSNIGNIIIPGGSNNFVLGTNGFGNLRWVPNTELLRKPSGSNTFVQFNDGGDFGAVSTFVFDKSTSTMGIGSIVTSGNVSVQGNTVTNNMTSNGNVSGTIITASTRFTGSGVGLTNIPGGNVTGTVPNATTSTFAGTVTTGAQPNITSVGTLTGLAVNGLISAPNVSITNTTTTIKFSTGTVLSNLIPDGDFISSLGNSTKRWKDMFLGGTLSVAGNSNIANVTGIHATFTTVDGSLTTGNQPNISNIGTLGNLTVTNKVEAGILVGDGGNIANIQGSNITGEVSYASIANSIDVSNVTNIGNIATINLDGDTSKVLKGDGSWDTMPTTVSLGTYEIFSNVDGIFFRNTLTTSVYTITLTPLV